MKRYIMMALLVFIVACTQQTGNDYRFEDIYKGNEGLRFNFMTNAPPSEVYDGSGFQAIVNLENKGATEIKDGTLVMSLEQDYMQLTGQDNERKLDLYGRDINRQFGEQKREVFTLNAKIPEKESQSQYHKTQIYVTACYKYQTKLKADVCVDTDVYNLRERTKPCRTSDYFSSSGQGAPVAVTRVEEKMIPEGENQIKPSYKIYVRNQRNGEVVLSEVIGDACGAKVGKDSLNKIKLTDVKLSSYSLQKGDFECGSQQEGTTLTLREGEDFIICTLKNGISMDVPSFLTGLEIDLEYGYTETTAKEVKIVRKLTY